MFNFLICFLNNNKYKRYLYLFFSNYHKRSNKNKKKGKIFASLLQRFFVFVFFLWIYCFYVRLCVNVCIDLVRLFIRLPNAIINHMLVIYLLAVKYTRVYNNNRSKRVREKCMYNCILYAYLFMSVTRPLMYLFFFIVINHLLIFLLIFKDKYKNNLLLIIEFYCID